MIGAQPDALLTLAKSREPADRERLLMSIVGLCEMAGAGVGSDAARNEAIGAKALIDDLFTTLLVDAEHGVRRRLAERIAGADWAPATLIALLALDDIEIARPVLASSPLLDDEDLVRLLRDATPEHQVEIARRPGIGPAVVETALAIDDVSVLAALLANPRVDIPSHGMKRLVEASRRAPALRARLARHPALDARLAARLYSWVGDPLREILAARFPLDCLALDARLFVEAAALAQPDPIPAPVQARGDASPQLPGQDQDALEHRLIEKLDAAGQLRPGYLLRALREAKLGLFEIGLARLAGLDLDALRAALSRERPDMLALACVAAGIDRSVFKTILERVRELNGGRPPYTGEGDAQALALFHGASPRDAAAAFMRLAQA